MQIHSADQLFDNLNPEERARYSEFMRMWLEVDLARMQWLLDKRKTEMADETTSK